MGTLYRSEKMVLCQLFLQNETAFCCISRLGELGLVQFRDCNASVNAFQRSFINQVRRCEEVERKLRYFRSEIRKANIPESAVRGNPLAPHPRDLTEFELECEKLEAHLKEETSNTIALKERYLEMIELRQILSHAKYLFDEDDIESAGDSAVTISLIRKEQIPKHPLGCITGVILQNRFPSFERTIWRACYGNVFLRHTTMIGDVEDPNTGEQLKKVVFVLFFQGDRLKSRAEKICDGYRATIYPCPDTKEEREIMLKDLDMKMTDVQLILNKTMDEQYRLLVSMAKNINVWFVKCRKVMAVFHTMNMFNVDIAKECMVAEGWCAEKNLNWIKQVLRLSTEESGSDVPSILNQIPSKEPPPTYNITNGFTKAFQAIVDAYGVADYTEVNPAPFTIITFPFIFAVMFGDAGHGFLMASFAAWMVYTENKWLDIKTDNEMWNIIFAGRYVLLLMGLFSMYTGILYNEVFSKSINIFGSSWNCSSVNIPNSTSITVIMLDPATSYSKMPYPFGIDPVWETATNKILFLNSYKMKISVIFGITQMIFGVILSLMNQIYFKSALDIVCLFVPQMIYLVGIFGYLVFMIFFKWIMFTVEQSSCAPSLLMSLINMFLYKYSEEPCYLAQMYHGQKMVQTVLVLLAVGCIPWMIAVKPIAKRLFPTKCIAAPKMNEEEETGFGNDLILQGIVTIEFCLGVISHTASYLRLWALSLAHAELSEVLWIMVMRIGLLSTDYMGAAKLYFVFAFWAVLTIGILLVMEGLSAFLHTLRLHWVEFQSKFYDGQGYPFNPFYFETILADEEQAEKLSRGR